MTPVNCSWSKSHRWMRGIGLVLCCLGATDRARAMQSSASEDTAATRAKIRAIQWLDGPATGRLGTVAELGVPATCRFTESSGAASFLEATHNIPTGRELGVLVCPDTSGLWFVTYTYSASGYVRDDEKGKLDANAILESLRRGTEEANKERRSRGWDEMHVEGWVRPPYYDQLTNNLTWSFTGKSTDGSTAINHSVRLLGRGGVLNIELVLSPEQLGTVVASFDTIMTKTTFLSGSRYAEWREGDKVAAYGLTALVAGGVGAIAMKTGLLAKLGKLLAGVFVAMWKLIIAAVVGLLAWVKKLFSRRKDPDSPPAS